MKKRVPDKFWFPWWPDKWIFGSVRIEFTPAERGMWVDMLSLASKDDGHIRANEDTPYPLAQLAGMLIIPEEELDAAIKKFIKFKKLTKLKSDTLYVTKWEKYQFSERHKRRLEGEMSDETDTMSPKKDPIIDNSTLNDNKLDNRENEIKREYILNLLSKVKDYPFSEKKDREFIKGLMVDFPDLDALEEIKKKCAWWLSNPILKKSNPHLQLRNWFLKARQFLKEGDVNRGVGKSYTKEDEFLPMELLNRVYKIISARGESIEEFYTKAKSAFPKIKAQWEQSDKKPKTFIKLVEEVK